MTVSDLAKKMQVTVDEFFQLCIEIDADVDFKENNHLSPEQIKLFIPSYTPEKFQTEYDTSPVKVKPIGTIDLNPVKVQEIKFNVLTKQASNILNTLSPFFLKSDKNLLGIIFEHNNITNLIFEGSFTKIAGNNFGFFKDVLHKDCVFLRYPILNIPIDDLFILSTELKNGQRYVFEATIARKNERIKKGNPFLLQAKSQNIQEIIELSVVSDELKLKQIKLQEVTVLLENAHEQFAEKKTEELQNLAKALEEEQTQANILINQLREKINEKTNEIEVKKNVLLVLNETTKTTNLQIQKMENLLGTLKNRVSLCRNLQFISEDDENKYLNLLSAKEFKPLNHHDFEKDFEKNFSSLSEHIHTYLYYKKNLIYTSHQIRNFLTLLRTHDIIVLSGLSGSGKTQIVKAFAEALGGVAKIIPVKPNWTSSDDLIGYYNPLQMSFLPTPFTEAIVEAINNPNQLYFICLDEMNLARVEYYFADFLSKLEERSKQPEIELYANHEEELFVSEFSTLLNLVESSIKGEHIKSWQEFLDNEDARKRFYEMLGNTDKESMLQLHAKMKRRLIDILKFPSTIRIPDNVRFIGAINVDETTHYFSPKILDRIHVVKFDNPLLYEEQVNSYFDHIKIERDLKPVFVNPIFFRRRMEYPSLRKEEFSFIENELKKINQTFLIPMKIDFGIRSIRQALNYYDIVRIDEKRVLTNYDVDGSSWEEIQEIEFSETLQVLNTIIIQKILPRFVFDGSELTNSGKTKADIAKEFCIYLKDELKNYMTYDSDGAPYDHVGAEIEFNAYSVLNDMIKNADNNSQFNFFS